MSLFAGSRFSPDPEATLFPLFILAFAICNMRARREVRSEMELSVHIEELETNDPETSLEESH